MPYNQIEWIDVSLDEIENSGFEVSELVFESGEKGMIVIYSSKIKDGHLIIYLLHFSYRTGCIPKV